MSKTLNMFIPKILGIPTTDITNGLRRYSRSAVRILLDSPQETFGFIYLSEQATILKKKGLNPHDVPIEFTERVGGHSSVNLKLLRQSIVEISRLMVRS
jgi:hypothetical protein